METKTETVAQKALRLLSEVPKESFIVGEFGDGNGKCCAIGHYVRLTSENPNNFHHQACHDNFQSDLRLVSKQFLMEKHSLRGCIADVNNDNDINGYKAPEIKDRVIHLLEDMVKEGL